ncbi:MAG: FAD-dependent oxidoreductase [Mariniphaga sp.]|nr:FAD-dependent oxidoreductase [Mariniphaga sp.]
MMKRRNFIKTTAAGSAFIMTSGAFAIGNPVSRNNFKSGFQSERRIPVAYDVDVVIVGGTSAAVAAATTAAKHGVSVFLAAPQPYLGEDICGTYRLWAENEKATSTGLGKKIFGAGLPTPMHVKKTLDDALIDSGVNFLYSSYVTDIIHDSEGHLAGVIISNRSGRQAVKAKVIIDATSRGLVARLSGADFSGYPAGKHEFKYVVVGNQPKNIPDGKVEKLPQPIVFKDKSYDAFEYTLLLDMPNDSWDSFCRAEHEARDLTWDPGQVDAGDVLFQLPPDFITGKEKWNLPVGDEEQMNTGSFRPKNTDRLFVLSGVADVHRDAAAEFLQPGGLIRMGERIGQAAAEIAGEVVAAKKYLVKGLHVGEHVPGDVGEILEGLRPMFNLGEIPSQETQLPILGNFDVVVLGGGTAGAPTGVGASRHGAKTLVLEYLHGLGGMGTLGMIGRYWDGYREGYTREVDRGVTAIGGDHPRQKERLDEWVFDWKTEYFRREIRDSGGEVWFGVLGIGAYVHEGVVKGVIVATPAGKGIVLGHTVIDSTGSADIAIAAGAAYEYTDGLSVAVQGAGMPFKNPNDHYNNTDWTFTSDTDMLDVWRTFIVAKDKFAGQYDLGKIPQTRERRRMIGDYTVSVLDIYNKRTYPDTFSIHQSSFDTHGYTEDPFFSLRWPGERTKHITALVPFRALLPKGLEGIAVTGLGASAHRDAMPVIRMQPCLQNQGFSMGWAAALAAENNRMIRYIDLKGLQKQLVEIKNLPEGADNYTDNYPPTMQQIQDAAKKVVNELEGLEILLWDKNRSIPVMEDSFYLCQNREHRLVYARILGMLGKPAGWKELIDAIDEYNEWDKGWNYRGMGQFGRSLSYLDSLIIALGRTRKVEAVPSIVRLANMLTPDSEFSHFHAVAMALETIASRKGAEPLFRLLNMDGVRGHAMTDIQTAKKLTPTDRNDNSTRNNSLRELMLGRALYRVGDLNGMGREILDTYSKDLRGHYYRHASGVLQLFSGQAEVEIEL